MTRSVEQDPEQAISKMLSLFQPNGMLFVRIVQRSIVSSLNLYTLGMLR